MESNTSVIYITLLDEGTDVVRPTRAVSLGNDRYQVLATRTTSIGNFPREASYDAFPR